MVIATRDDEIEIDHALRLQASDLEMAQIDVYSYRLPHFVFLSDVYNSGISKPSGMSLRKYRFWPISFIWKK